MSRNNEQAPAAARSQFNKQQLTLFLGAALVIATLFTFWSVRQCEFINYDDPDYVTENPHVLGGLTGANVQWAFGAKFASNWHPLTWLSHMADVQIRGTAPGGHHFTSLLLHAANVLLLFLLLNRMTGAVWRSAVVAALFAIHPLRVQSVAWISERKDVLSGFFFMLTLLAWAVYSEKLKTHKPAKRWYGIALAMFALGLMSKPMLVTVPAILLLIDIWPLGRMQSVAVGKAKQPSTASSFDFSKLGNLIMEKVPFAALAFLSSILTMQAQRAGGSVKNLEEFPLMLRLDNALISYVRYIGKMFWPTDLAVFYPYPKEFPGWQVLGALAVLLVVSALVIRLARQKSFLLVGWLWFALMLVPVIGLVQVGIQSSADRYTYLPMIGLYVMLTWVLADLLSGMKLQKAILGTATAAALAGCFVVTQQQLRYWRNNESLYQRALAVTTKDNYVANENLGVAYARTGRLDESEHYLRIARDTHQDYAEAHHNLGNSLHRLGRDDEAILCYKEAIRLKPDYDAAMNNLGFIRAKQGQFDEARFLYLQAAQLTPNDPVVHYNLAAALVQLDKVSEGINEYLRSLELDPGMPQAHFQLAAVFAGTGKKAEAITHLREALRLKPDYAEAQEQLNQLSR